MSNQHIRYFHIRGKCYCSSCPNESKRWKLLTDMSAPIDVNGEQAKFNTSIQDKLHWNKKKCSKIRKACQFEKQSDHRSRKITLRPLPSFEIRLDRQQRQPPTSYYSSDTGCMKVWHLHDARHHFISTLHFLKPLILCIIPHRPSITRVLTSSTHEICHIKERHTWTITALLVE